MDPMTILAIAQAGKGVIDKIGEKNLRRRAKKNFTPYSIPSSANAMLAKANSLATQRGVIGEDIYRNKAMGSVASGIEASQRTAEAPSDVLAVLGRLNKNYQNFEGTMAIEGSNAYERRQKDLMNTLMQFSQFETDRWRYNELYPYMQTLTEAGQVGEAGNMNLQSALSAGMSIYGANKEMDFQQKMFGEWKDWMKGNVGNSNQDVLPPYDPNNPFSGWTPSNNPT